MNKIKRDNRGISIIIALTGVFVFAVFSSIILSATSNNVRSAQKQHAYQQAYLSVTNAADLFIDSFVDDYFKIEKTVYITSTGVEGKSELGNWSYVEGENTLANPLTRYDEQSASNIRVAFSNAYLGSLIENDYVFTTRVSDGGGKVFEAKVNCHLFVLPEGDMVANFSLDGVKSNENYYMYVVIPVKYLDVNTDYPTKKGTVTSISGVSGYTKKRVDEYKIFINTKKIAVHKGVYSYAPE